MDRLKIALAFVVCSFAGLQPAAAQVTVYTDRTAFIAALYSYSTDTYDGLTYQQAYNSPLSRANGAYPYTASSSSV